MLVGIHVVSLAVNLPGPLAAARLSELGASVTKIEPPAGDPLAAAAPGWYSKLVRAQQVAFLDLKDPHGRAKLDIELTGADLLITAMRPSALCRLGLTDAHITYPGLSHVEIVGYDGELEETPGHDLNYQAVNGMLQPPTMPTVPVADLLGAERAVSAALLMAACEGANRYRAASARGPRRRRSRRGSGGAPRSDGRRGPARRRDPHLRDLRHR